MAALGYRDRTLKLLDAAPALTANHPRCGASAAYPLDWYYAPKNQLQLRL